MMAKKKLVVLKNASRYIKEREHLEHVLERVKALKKGAENLRGQAHDLAACFERDSVSPKSLLGLLIGDTRRTIDNIRRLEQHFKEDLKRLSQDKEKIV